MSKGFITGHDTGIGKGQRSNLPQEVIKGDYPKCKHYNGPEYDDTMTDVDDVRDSTVGKVRKNISYQK